MSGLADTLLAQGTAAIRSVHGERLTRRAASDIIGTEYGEAVASEEGKAILAGNASDESFICNWFDEFYQEASPDGISIAITAPACEVSDDQLGNLKRNDVITRNGIAYYVQNIQPDGFGNNLLLLSKQVQ